MECGFATQRICLLGAIFVVAGINGNDWSHAPITDTRSGRVKGLRTSVHGTEVDVYYGIPYAKPPVNDLRFKHPVPIDPWNGIYDASKKPNACFQGPDTIYPDFPGATMWHANTNLSEDCLYLNVWVPRTNLHSAQKKHVMVWIFGGGFMTGTAMLDVYDAKYLAAENDIIVVSMQYRLGALGFLYLDSHETPGNAGMFDQVMSLQWVQNNIHYFGGDRHSVTLFGESAGGASVGMHMLSPLSRGYFQRAIIQSAAPHAAWAVLTDKESKRRSVQLADILGCSQQAGTHNLVQCLRKVPPEDFVMQEYDVITYGVVRFPFTPMVDGTFLTESPKDSLDRNSFKKCPLLLGHNTNEASFWMTYYDKEIFPIHSDVKLSESQFDLFIDEWFHFYPYYPKLINSFGIEAIKFIYRNWLNPHDQEKNVWQLDMAVGDFNFICPTVDLAQYYASALNDVFYYVFDHRSSTHYWPEWMGVAHGDEINFVFGEPLDHLKRYTRDEKIFSKKVMKYWTNFAKTGNPNKDTGGVDIDEWPLYDNVTRKHLILRSDLINNLDKSRAIKEGARVQQCAFWKEYLPKLLMTTANMSEMEVQWKIQFNDWSTKYIVEWKKEFNNFIQHHRSNQQMTTCGRDVEP